MQSYVPPRAQRAIRTGQQPQFPWNSSGRNYRRPNGTKYWFN
jgi:hypothetical protein